jgi:hypothetical protein
LAVPVDGRLDAQHAGFAARQDKQFAERRAIAVDLQATVVPEGAIEGAVRSEAAHDGGVVAAQVVGMREAACDQHCSMRVENRRARCLSALRVGPAWAQREPLAPKALVDPSARGEPDDPESHHGLPLAIGDRHADPAAGGYEQTARMRMRLPAARDRLGEPVRPEARVPPAVLGEAHDRERCVVRRHPEQDPSGGL